MTMARAKDEFTQRFYGIIREAGTLPAQLETDFRLSGKPSQIAGGDFPAVTALRLLRLAEASYLAAVACLRSGETSVGALTLMRGELECLAHLAFVHGENPADGGACRAAAYEASVALELNHVVRKVQPDDEEQIKAVEKRIREIDAIRSRLGCTVRYRGYGAVSGTLRELAKRPGLDWVFPLYTGLSATSHQQFVEWIVVERGDGFSEWRDPSASVRVSWLMQCIAVIEQVTWAAASIMGLSPITHFASRAARVKDHPLLERAAGGLYD